MEAAKNYRPKKGVLVSAGPEHEKVKFLEAAAIIRDLGLPMYATRGTANYLQEHGFDLKTLAWPGEAPEKGTDVITAIQEHLVDLVINIPKSLERQELSYGARIRQASTQFGVGLLTDMEKTVAFITAMGRHRDFVKDHEVVALPNYR
jgi:carbamoyl-phosphate synthase large subunit